MDGLLDLLERMLGGASTPVRRELRLHGTRDDRGNPTIEALGGEVIVLSPTGNSEDSVDRIGISSDRFFGGCGCTTNFEVGGKCSEPGCHLIYCIRCATRCSVCLKSLCLSCATRIPTEAGEKDLCHVCTDEFQWRNTVSRATLGLFPPARF